MSPIPAGRLAPLSTIPEYFDDVLQGRTNPGRVFDLGGITEACAAMDARRGVKSLVRVGPV
jgi:hypothetical protein